MVGIRRHKNNFDIHLTDEKNNISIRLQVAVLTNFSEKLTCIYPIQCLEIDTQKSLKKNNRIKWIIVNNSHDRNVRNKYKRIRNTILGFYEFNKKKYRPFKIF